MLKVDYYSIIPHDYKKLDSRRITSILSLPITIDVEPDNLLLDGGV